MATAPQPLSPILVVGSVNVDLIMEVHRLPNKGETTISRNPRLGVAVGGKGANQAVAAARLCQGTNRKIQFICRFGNDSYASMLEQELVDNSVDVTGCQKVTDMPSGHGMVMLETDGSASSVVLGGANTAWTEWEPLPNLIAGVGAVLLQREIPEHVNLAVAAAAHQAGVPVIQDVGGEDRPVSHELLKVVDYLVPNESELQRITGMPTDKNEQVIAAARTLINLGVRNILVTLAEKGAVLVSRDGGILWQDAAPVPGGVVVDGTAAGDAFRAAFAVGLVEGWPLQDVMRFAAAAGAVVVSRLGAVPSLPTRSEVLALLGATPGATAMEGTSSDTAASLRGVHHESPSGLGADTCVGLHVTPASSSSGSSSGSSISNSEQLSCRGPSCTSSSQPSVSTSSSSASGNANFPYKFASRLNSMKARRDLVRDLKSPASSNNVLGWIARQGQINGLDLVYLNYPQHFEAVDVKQITAALKAARLTTGAVCIRFPADQFQLGAFSHPDPTTWQAAVDLAVEGCGVAADLGATDLIIWSPYDGYDYHLQVNFIATWNRTVTAFQAVADKCAAGIKVSLEFKPTDENSRYSIVPSTGAALLLAQQVNRQHVGLTLDVGHMLLAGENPAQSVAMVAAAGKLFGVQLNDAHVKLGAEDGLAFGSVNPVMALELLFWLQTVKYDGYIFFDTFPVNEDPVREAEYNIRQVVRMWRRSAGLDAAGMGQLLSRHDALGVLELLEADVQAGIVTC